jgi:hypothetical protein
MKMFKAKIYGEEGEFKLTQGKYSNGNTYVGLISEGRPYATLSVNLPQSDLLQDGEFYMKEWSENEPVAQAVKQLGLVEATPRIPVESGRVSNIRAYKLSQKGIEALEE